MRCFDDLDPLRRMAVTGCDEPGRQLGPQILDRFSHGRSGLPRAARDR
jgi:hypothetical protein